MSDMAYHVGVYMGDGYIENYAKLSSTVRYVGLKCVDRDFVEHYTDVLERLTGQRYKIRTQDDGNPKHNVRYICRCGDRALVDKTDDDTQHKSVVPVWILSGTNEEKKSFLQGIMDSEAWITASLNPLGQSNIQLSVGVTDRWCFDLHRMFGEIGVDTTKVNKRTFGHEPKYLKPRKDFLSFSINILQYVDVGLSFNIRRKRERLMYCSNILRDFTREYPRYENYLGKDKVRPLDES